MSLIIHIFEVFFLLLCELVYSIASYIYALLITISESNVFTSDIIKEFSSRVYVLLGVFMLFKVSLSLINYIVNPDDFTDKQKGVGKLVPNIMVTLVLIVFTPRIFAELMDLQHLLTSQHFFERIILGPTYVESNTLTQDVGDNLAVNLFGAFYYYPSSVEEPLLKGITTKDPNDGARRYNSTSNAFDHGSDYNVYTGIWEDKSVAHPLFALIAGVVLVLVLIQFCFDIAIRTVKFGFLQLIAAIPIMSRIDPKSAKDGMFGKWLKLASKTYLDLFMRLIALYFAIALIGVIMHTEIQINSNITGFNAWMVKAFLMLGALLFAKQLPKMLEDLFGFKLDGGFTLNPMKRLKEVPGANIAAAGAAAVGGAAVGFGANMYAGAKDVYNKFNTDELKARHVLGMFGSAFAGGTSSLFRSGYSGMKDNKLKPFKAIGKGVKGSVAARELRDEREDMGEGGISGFVGRVGTKINQFTGVQGSDEDTLKRERKYKLGQEFYKKYGEYLTDKNGNLVTDAQGNYFKAGEYELDADGNPQARAQKIADYKYKHFEEYDKEMADKWKEIEKYKVNSYDYDNSREEAKKHDFSSGKYVLELKNPDGTITKREYDTLKHFEEDYNKYMNTYNKEKKAFEEMMTKVEHERFKKEYDLYTSAADNIENEIKLSDLTKTK